jgi:hypothetical protein
MRRSVVDSEAERSALTRHMLFVPSLNAQLDTLLLSADYKMTVVYKHLQEFCNTVSCIVPKLVSSPLPSCRVTLEHFAVRGGNLMSHVLLLQGLLY